MSDPRIADFEYPQEFGVKGGCDCIDCQTAVAEVFDRRDAAAGIVRVDTTDPATVERVAHTLRGWFSDGYDLSVPAAHAVLSALLGAAGETA